MTWTLSQFRMPGVRPHRLTYGALVIVKILHGVQKPLSPMEGQINGAIEEEEATRSLEEKAVLAQELASSVTRKATCPENALRVEVEEVEPVVPEPASSVAKKDTCLASARKAEAVVELELEDPGLALSVEKKAISQENAHREAEVAVAHELAITAVRKVTCPENALKKESLELAAVAVAAEGDHATIVAKMGICLENALSQEMRTIVAEVAAVVEVDLSRRVLDEMTNLCKSQPLELLGVQQIIKTKPGAIQPLAVEQEQIGTQVHPQLQLPQVVAGERVLPLNKKLQAKQSPLMNGQHLLSHNLYKTVVGAAPKKKPKKIHRAIMQVINGQVHQLSRRQVVVDGVPKALNLPQNLTITMIANQQQPMHGEAKFLKTQLLVEDGAKRHQLHRLLGMEVVPGVQIASKLQVAQEQPGAMRLPSKYHLDQVVVAQEACGAISATRRAICPAIAPLMGVQEPLLVEETVDLELVSSVTRKATCPENVPKEGMPVVPEPVLNVAKKDTCHASVLRAEEVEEVVEQEDPEPVSNVEKKATSQENAHKEAEVAVAHELATTAVRKVTCPETVLKKESLEPAAVAVAVAAEEDRVTIVAKMGICPENALSQEMKTIVAEVAVVAEVDSSLQVLDETTSLCKKQPLELLGVQQKTKTKPGAVQPLAPEQEQTGTQVHKLPRL